MSSLNNLLLYILVIYSLCSKSVHIPEKVVRNRSQMKACRNIIVSEHRWVNYFNNQFKEFLKLCVVMDPQYTYNSYESLKPFKYFIAEC